MKINDVRISAEGKDGTKFEYKATATVTSDGGRFTVELHEDLCEIAEKISSPGLGVERSHGKWRVSGFNLKLIVKFIEDCAQELLNCETKTERVIIYGYQLNIHFWIDEEGEIHPNGASREGAWFKGSADYATTKIHQFYSVGFAARVLDKTSYIRKTGTKTVYDLVREKTEDEALEALNSFVRLGIGDDEELGVNTGCKEMPYSPEATKFFYGVMLNLCKLAQQIHTFFGDEPAVLKAIQSGNLLTFK